MVTRIESLFTEKVNRITNLEPFNHGTTSIEYDIVSNEAFQELVQKISEGWSIQTTNIEQVREKIFYSNKVLKECEKKIGEIGSLYETFR